MGGLSYTDVKQQSLQVYGQFGEKKWIPFARDNARLPHRETNELRNSGIGRTLVCAAMGESLEEQIPTLLKYRDRFDLVTNDKTFGYLVERGITPDYVLICDCNVVFDKWLARHVEKTEGVKLIANCYANTDWTKAWKGPVYFFINKDSIASERKFLPIMGENTRVIPASSNVSNAMVVFFVGADGVTQNWAGYERYLLAGFDYSWRPEGKYYAFEDVRPKRFYMTHRTMLDINNDIVRSSENLVFSAKWLAQYVQTFNLPVVNCSERGLLQIRFRNTLEKELAAINPDRRRSRAVRDAFAAVTSANQTFVAAKELFHKQREELYLCQ